MKAADRQTDEMILEWIAARVAGESSHTIAARYGCRPERVRTATSRVLEADVQHCGKGVLTAYWDRSTGGRA